jgi:hypothetical protein
MEEKIYRWRKVGGGSFRLRINGRACIVKPNQEFSAPASAIPIGFRDVVICLDGDPVILEKEPEMVVKPSEYTLKVSGRAGYFNIFDASGKKVNEKAMKEDDAKRALADLIR